MCNLYLELLGFAAGFTNLSSSLPQLITNMRTPEFALHQSTLRNGLQCAGNGMWLVYGWTACSIAMTIFAALGCSLTAILLWQVKRAKRRCNRVNLDAV